MQFEDREKSHRTHLISSSSDPGSARGAEVSSPPDSSSSITLIAPPSNTVRPPNIEIAPLGTPLGVLLDLTDSTEGLLSSRETAVEVEGLLGVGAGGFVSSSSSDSSSVLSNIESEREKVVLLLEYIGLIWLQKYYIASEKS